MRLIVWAVIAVVAFVVLRRLGIAALFQKKTATDQPSIFGGGGDMGVTAPGVTPTPVGPTGQTTHADTGNPVTTVSGVDLYNIAGSSYLGAKGASSADVKPGYYKTATSGGDAIASANIPGVPGMTQGITSGDLSHLTDFHRNDANVIAQVNAEKSRVAPGQTYKAIGGYRPDGSPILIY